MTGLHEHACLPAARECRNYACTVMSESRCMQSPQAPPLYWEAQSGAVLLCWPASSKFILSSPSGSLWCPHTSWHALISHKAPAAAAHLTGYVRGVLSTTACPSGCLLGAGVKISPPACYVTSKLSQAGTRICCTTKELQQTSTRLCIHSNLLGLSSKKLRCAPSYKAGNWCCHLSEQHIRHG